MVNSFKKKLDFDAQKSLSRRLSSGLAGLKWAAWWRNAEWLVGKFKAAMNHSFDQLPPWLLL